VRTDGDHGATVREGCQLPPVPWELPWCQGLGGQPQHHRLLRCLQEAAGAWPLGQHQLDCCSSPGSRRVPLHPCSHPMGATRPAPGCSRCLCSRPGQPLAGALAPSEEQGQRLPGLCRTRQEAMLPPMVDGGPGSWPKKGRDSNRARCQPPRGPQGSAQYRKTKLSPKTKTAK